MDTRSNVRALVIGLSMLALVGWAACQPAATDPDDDTTPDATPDATPEEAAEMLTESMTTFMEDGSDSSARDLHDAMQQVYESTNDLDEAMEAAEYNTYENIESTEDLEELIENSLMFDGWTAGTADETTDSSRIRSIRSDENCDELPDTVVLFVNGINNSFPEFLSSLAAMGRALQTVNADLDFDGYYNLSGKDGERSTFGGWVCPIIAGFLYSYPLHPLSGTDISEYCQGVGVGLDLIESGLQLVDIQTWGSLVPEDTAVGAFREFIQGFIDDGKNVIIVAHSQGNLLTSLSLEPLAEVDDADHAPPIDSIGVVSVGSPTTTFATSTDNTVPIMVSGEIMDSLFFSWDANVFDVTLDGMVARHSFNGSYMRSETARSLLRDGVEMLASSLRNTRGKILVTATVTDASTGEPVEDEVEVLMLGDPGPFAANTSTNVVDGGLQDEVWVCYLPYRIRVVVQHEGYHDYESYVGAASDTMNDGLLHIDIALTPDEDEEEEVEEECAVWCTVDDDCCTGSICENGVCRESIQCFEHSECEDGKHCSEAWCRACSSPRDLTIDPPGNTYVTANQPVTVSWEGGCEPFTLTWTWNGSIPGYTTEEESTEEYTSIRSLPWGEPDVYGLYIVVTDRSGSTLGANLRYDIMETE